MIRLSVTIYYMIIVISLFTSCSSDNCGNTGSTVGKYVAETFEDTELFLIIKADGTFVHHYKDKTGKIYNKVGKWSLSKLSCSINLNPWYCLSQETHQDKPTLMTAIFENDKIIPYTDVPIYKKVRQ